ncbi:bifunctional hydroxymethylpyrimidine kinase/phosphomethylpyrimidine kinase [Endothiovibrio diazotrophicus]
MTNHPRIPVVLALSGHDPTGGAGIQADIEAMASMGCHCAPVITSIAVQDTRDVKELIPLDPTVVVAQARAVLEDMEVQAVKIGLLGSVQAVEAVHTLLTDYPKLPVVLDPILKAGGGTPLADEEVTEAIRQLLLPQTTLLTPNSEEARKLAPGADNLDACAQELMDRGAEFVLITGAHERDPQVINRLYGNRRFMEAFHWERLTDSYHGSGCTLAASLAGLLAQGLEPFSAVHEAQEYTWESLRNGYRLGMGQLIPNRLFWAHDEEDEGEQPETLH